MRQPLGQHFLRDLKVVKTIVAAGELKSGDVTLEIGPGRGVLTGEILGRGVRLTAVELDKAMALDVEKRFSGCDRFAMVKGDFLKSDLDALFPPEVRPVKVFGNLPYSITSPIFEKLMQWTGWSTGVFLIQREVAERIAGHPGSRTYGILTLAVQLFANVETIAQVPPGAFNPPPRVTSAVIRLRRKAAPPLAVTEIPAFFDLAHGAFAHRRKTIANSLAFHSGIARASIEKWLLQAGITPSSRAETLGLNEYAALATKWSVFRRENGFDNPNGNVYNSQHLRP